MTYTFPRVNLWFFLCVPSIRGEQEKLRWLFAGACVCVRAFLSDSGEQRVKGTTGTAGNVGFVLSDVRRKREGAKCVSAWPLIAGLPPTPVIGVRFALTERKSQSQF